MVSAVIYSFSSIEALRFAATQEVKHAPYVVAWAGCHVRDAALTRADWKIEPKLEIPEQRHSDLERLHLPPPEEDARVEIAPVREVPEGR